LYISIIPVLGRLRKEDQEFQANLGSQVLRKEQKQNKKRISVIKDVLVSCGDHKVDIAKYYDRGQCRGEDPGSLPGGGRVK
jgi:hypothetical protein